MGDAPTNAFSYPIKPIEESKTAAKEERQTYSEQHRPFEVLRSAEPTRRDAPKWTDVAIVILTLGLVFVGILQYLIFQKQWQEMNASGRQTDELIHAATINATAAKSFAESTAAITAEINSAVGAFQRMATSSEKSMLATKDAMRLDEKAWVSIDSIQIDGEPSLGSPMKFIVKVKNTGKTPALSAAITQQGFGSKQTTALCPIERQLLLFSVVAPASQDSFYLSAKPDVSQGMLDGFKNGSLTVFIKGLFEYRDVFNQPRHTGFCVYYPSDRLPFLLTCQTGNYID